MRRTTWHNELCASVRRGVSGPCRERVGHLHLLAYGDMQVGLRDVWDKHSAADVATLISIVCGEYCSAMNCSTCYPPPGVVVHRAACTSCSGECLSQRARARRAAAALLPVTAWLQLLLTCVCEHVHKEVEQHHHLCGVEGKESNHQLPLCVQHTSQAADREDVVGYG